MTVLELQPLKRVVWQVLDGPEELLVNNICPRKLHSAAEKIRIRTR